MQAQTPSVVMYTTKDGLASQRVYGAAEDHYGNIWFATDNGISKFNGQEFSHLNPERQLQERSIKSIYCEPEGGIWFWGIKPTLGYIKNDSIRYYSFAEIDLEIIALSKINPRELLIGFSGKSIIYDLKQEKIVRELNISAASDLFSDGRNELIIGIGSISKYSGNTGNRFSNKNLINNNKFFNCNGVPCYLNSKGDLFRYANSEHKFDRIQRNNLGEIQKIYKRPDNSFLILMRNNTILQGEIKDDKVQINRQINSSFQINGLLLDKRNNIWVCTNNSGVGIYKDNGPLTFTTDNGLSDMSISKLFLMENGKIMAGSENSQMDIIDIENNTMKRINLESRIRKPINSIVQTPDGKYWISSEDELFVLSDNTIVEKVLSQCNQITNLNIKDDEHVWISTTEGIFEQRIDRPNCKTRRAEEIIIQGRNYDIASTGDTTWLGTAEGLFHIVQDDTIFMGEDYFLLSTPISDIAIHDGRILVSTQLGFCLINESTVYEYHNQNSNLPNSSCKKIWVDEPGKAYWIATESGLIKAGNIEDPDSLDFSIFDIYDGLISNRINDVLVDPLRNIWVATDRGISIFADSYISRTIPNIRINKVQIFNKDTALLNEYILPHRQNNIRIFYESTYFDGIATYLYKLEGWDTDWISTEHAEVLYPKLPPGPYKFKVFSISKEGIRSIVADEIKINILYPFWQKWWFFLSTGLLIGSIIAIIVRWRIKTIQSRAQERSEYIGQLSSLELRNLHSQMNSHFLFNSLNVIQSFILEQKDEAALHYLSKFAQLIRKFLENSRQKWIYIKDELKLLELYTELEELKLNHSFKTNIIISEEINIYQMMIPPMMIQPFVENAIRHGLKHISNAGLLNINLEMLDDYYLTCHISDNGIGRKRSLELNKAHFPSHKSLGSSINEQRIKKLNVLYNKEADIVIEDLNPDQDDAGTLVKLKLPIKY